ncbi:ABC transporter substrate-binding protein [Bacteriovorax sp. Seq25_V]|uniref:substrate-binding periplasmic protein n=1 Tax=Bacteriovorax sp. Seq25_V TaxID=1201288 RepID=UPI00038A26CD|nr:transporter substrate-binding domain-containing protein [Bacteriovorax sp. Seq25_V]EQC43766.1 ABC transporter, substrate-binding protein, family 3 [Bacteriovorax sp. Seq25_V]
MKNAILIFLISLFSNTLFAKEIIIVNDYFPPYVENEASTRGSVGIDMEMAIRVLKKNGIEYKVLYVPWQRALRMLEDGEADMITTISPTEERSEFLNFSLAYRKKEELSFFVLRESNIELTSLYDLRRSTLGLNRGFVYPKEIVENPNIEKKYVYGVEEGFQNLKDKRLRIYLVNTVVGEKMIEKLKLQNVIKKLDFKVKLEGDASQTMFGFSKKSEHKDLVELFNAELGQ